MKKNILMLNPSSDLYGASKIFVTAVDQLSSNGHNVIAIITEMGPIYEKLQSLNVDVRCIKLGIIRRKYYNVSGVFNRIFALYKSYKTVKKIIRDENIDLIFSQTSSVLIGAILSKFLKIKHIWQILEIIESPKWYYYLMSKIITASSDKIIVASQAVKNHWLKYIPESKMEVIHYGIDVNSTDSFVKSDFRKELGIDESKFLIGMIGRVNLWKGQSYFLDIAKMIHINYPNSFFIMVGDAFPGYEYLYDELKQKSIQLGFGENNFRNLGFRMDSMNILKSLDLFIQPSILPDPFPTVILESMSVGTPVVATNLGGAKEMIIENESGFFIPVDNPEKAFTIIDRVLTNGGANLKTVGKNGQKRIRELFSEQKYRKNLTSIVQHIDLFQTNPKW